MKLNKKTIIVILVVAVVAFLLWKRYKGQSATGGSGAASSGSYLNPNNLEDVIKAAQISSDLAAKVREKASACEASVKVHDTVAEKAAEKGNTFEQQVLFEALYPLYHVNNNGTWVAKSESDSNTWKAIVARVKAM